MDDRAFLEALKALTIDSGDPFQPGTSSRETTESATARLDDLIGRFRVTGIASSFPLGNETPKYGYNHLQSKPTDQDIPGYLIDLPGVAFSVLLQWHNIMECGLCNKEGSLTAQEWRGMTHFRHACRAAMERYNTEYSQRRRRNRSPRQLRAQTSQRARSASPSPRSRSPLRNRSPGPGSQNDLGHGNMYPTIPYKWTKTLELNPPKRYNATSIDICDMPVDDQRTYARRAVGEIERIRGYVLQGVESEGPEYRQALDLKVALHISAGFWTRQEGEAR